MLRLETASLNPPPGLQDLLTDLGDGENGFGGTPIHTGEMTLQEYLQHCCDMRDPSKVRPGLVPQTVFWVIDAEGMAVGIVRMRHYLNDRLRVEGGHIGFYIRRDLRSRGYATEALRLALHALRDLGERRALLTVDPDNLASISVIEANGGRLEDTGVDAEQGTTFARYWIDLDTAKPNTATT